MSLIPSILILTLSYFQSPTPERDMSRYEKMEHTVDGTNESGEPYLVKEREFIWDCWTQKRRCFASLKIEAKDNPPNMIQIFVEPNEKGVWNAVYLIDARLLD